MTDDIHVLVRFSVIKEESLEVVVVYEMVIEHVDELLLVVVLQDVLEELEWIPVVVPWAVSDLLIPSVA